MVVLDVGPLRGLDTGSIAVHENITKYFAGVDGRGRSFGSQTLTVWRRKVAGLIVCQQDKKGHEASETCHQLTTCTQ